jgi:hypothetical protein
VIGDSVNPLAITRDAWVDVATEAGARFVEIELVCSDAAEHRRRIKMRPADAAGLKPLTWQDVMSRDYERWNREHIVIDTTVHNPDQAATTIREILSRK